MCLLLLFLFIVSVCIGSIDEENLLQNLTMSYNRSVRPVLNDSFPLKVFVGLSISQIIDVVSSKMDCFICLCYYFLFLFCLLILSFCSVFMLFIFVSFSRYFLSSSSLFPSFSSVARPICQGLSKIKHISSRFSSFPPFLFFFS